MTTRRAGFWLVFALAAHVLLAGTYAWCTPAWEGPDENDHAYYASFLRATGRQPTILQSSDSTGRPSWEEASLGHHPPLYYALLGTLTAVLGSGDYTPYWSPMPERAPGAALQWQHGHDELAPVSEEIAVLRSLRLVSTLFGAAAIGLTFGLARVLFPARPGVAAGASVLLACLPQWSWMHGVLDNGNLATAWACLAVLWLARGVRARALGPASGTGLGLVLGLALLTKLTALFLLPLAVAVFTLAAWAWPRGRRRALLGGVLVAAVALAVSGAWFWRNAELYGDPLALAPHEVAYATNRLPPELRTSYLLGDFVARTARTTFAGIGWSLRNAPPWAELAAGGVLLLALLGWAWRARALAREGGAALAVACAALALTVAGVVQFNTKFIQPQGRYLFPAAGIAAVLLAAGLHALPRPRSAWPWSAAAALALGLALWLQHAHFLRMLSPAPPPSARYASYHEGMRTPTPAALQTIATVAPAAGAELSEAPTFRWHDPHAEPGVVYSVHLWLPSGVTFATWESAGIPIASQSWTMPAAFWESLPADTPLAWRVRRVADRARGEAACSQPGSELVSFVRRR